MRLLGVLALKDLRRRLADPGGLLVNLAIPLMIAGAMALTFGNLGGGSEPSVPKLRVVVVDLDQGPISRMMAGATQNPEAAKHMTVAQASTREEGLRLLRDEEYSAMIVIPVSFGEDVLHGRRTRLEVVKNPAQNVMPIAAQQITEVAALYVSGAAKLLGDDGPRLEELFAEDGWKDAAQLTALVTTLQQRARAIDEILLPPLIEVDEPEAEASSAGGFDFLAWMYPGMVVMGLIFTGMSQMKDLLRERDAGTLRRQLVSPVGPGQVLLSKILSVGLVVAVAEVILMAIGSMALGIHWGRLLPLLASAALLVLAVTGFSALFYSIVRTERQGDAYGGVLTMVMSLLGGAFVPVQVMPDWMAGLARFTVNYWGDEALRSLTTGGGWAEVAGYLQVLAALGLVMTILGLILLRRRHLRGAL